MKTVDIVASTVPASTPMAVQNAIRAVIMAPPVAEEWPVDHGFAEGDTTSVWIVTEGEKEFV